MLEKYLSSFIREPGHFAGRCRGKGIRSGAKVVTEKLVEEQPQVRFDFARGRVSAVIGAPLNKKRE
jgi:hypothetical protein